MTQPLSINEGVKGYYEKGFFRRDSHQLIAWGYMAIRATINPEIDEPTITDFLVRAMKEKLKDPYLNDRFMRYSVHENPPIPTNGRMGKDRPMPDIVVESNTPRTIHPEYVFEAKRLAGKKFTISKYCNYGLKRFLDGDYASDWPEVGMIGYVQKGSFENWEKELCQELPTKAELLTKKKPEKIRIIDDLEYEWISEHDRKINKPVTVYHIFLDCS
jgi:hypothetical protein